MADDFRPLNRETPMLLPPSIQEWLPDQHMARFVVELVEQLDLSEITSRYGGSGGRRAYHPVMLVALLFYGYATGVFSSRKLEQATYDSVAFRYITGDEHPDHDTIANFRKRFLGELEGLFKQAGTGGSTRQRLAQASGADCGAVYSHRPSCAKRATAVARATRTGEPDSVKR